MSSNISLPNGLSSFPDIDRVKQDIFAQVIEQKVDTSPKAQGSQNNLKISDSEAFVAEKKLAEAKDAEKIEITQATINEAINIVSEFINQPPRNVNFTQDTEAGRTVIKVFDNDSKELIKQFPSEELVSVAKKIKALHQEVGEQAGILLDTKV